MTARPLTGATRLAGVVGRPVTHSLSPLIHNAWLQAAGLDGAYVAFPIPEGGDFTAFANGLRGGVVAGLNVTVPFKEAALALADHASDQARAAGAANLLVFDKDGTILADNTDGEGLLRAIGQQAPGLDLTRRPSLVLGAGGAARGAVAALVSAGAPQVRLVNRGLDRAHEIAARFDKASAYGWERIETALDGVGLIVNATTLGLNGDGEIALPWASVPPDAAVMDMVYKPLRTGFLREAASRGHITVDGLAMLIGQAIPSFEALFGRPPPAEIDVRALAERALGER